MLQESILVCPRCGHAKRETMPTDACQVVYDCAGCGAVLRPKPGDCCVFCSYGSVPCPPVQMQSGSCCSDGLIGARVGERSIEAAESDLSRGIGFQAATLPERAPKIPDWSVVTQPRARAVLQDVYAAAKWDRRREGLDLDLARVLAALLRHYAGFGRPPSRTELANAVELSESSVTTSLERLAEYDLILLDRLTGAIQGAYPFTQAATGHSITLVTTNRTLATMCAIDALGAGAMCREDVTIRSACSFCGAPIEGHTFARGMALGGIAPVGAVVWAGLREARGCAADTLCGELLFFCCDAHLDGWRAGRLGAGYRLSPAEAFEVGKALFIDRAMMNGAAVDEGAKA